ncbi:MAG: pyridoxamine 5'-phosphate oxidase family protein [Paludibacter sp.]|nr:pyridoxamine 5'-phosphate oxidase family protein [Paludibacter sp.]
MKNSSQIRRYIEGILQSCRLAVLATEAHGQPHASLIAITPVQGFRQLIFSTYRNTRKFENILNNGRIAVLIQGEDKDNLNPQKGFALTAYGRAQEIGISELEEAVHAHLERHPNLVNMLNSENIVIIRIKVEAYQVVRGIDDVIWWPVVDSEN